jgi:Glyoxalase-like domain
VTVRIASITLDCADALVVATFWSAALGRPLDPNPSSVFASIGMPGRRDTEGWRLDGEHTWLFNQVPEPKTAKNRLHLDVAAGNPEAEIQRLVSLGATRVAEVDEWGYRWTVMNDPEGNEFCVAKAL